jgi:hypothetical protein
VCRLAVAGQVLKDISGEHPSVKFLSYGPPPADGGFGVRVDELVQQGSDTEPGVYGGWAWGAGCEVRCCVTGWGLLFVWGGVSRSGSER